MICVKCGQEIMEAAAFCPYCGEKVVRAGQGPGDLIYQAEVRKLTKSGKLLVYRDRTEFVTSSVQKAIFDYTGLIAVKKGPDRIFFLTEDGRTETCQADKKCVHEAFLYIEQAVRPYLAQRKERLLSQGVRYSFPSEQGFMNSGVLDLSAEQAEFRAKSGKSDVVSYWNVKSVSASGGTLNFLLFGGGSKSFSVDREMRDEVLSFAADSVASCLARRKEALLAQGIYFSSIGPEGRVFNVLADRVEAQDSSGQVESVPFQDIQTASLSLQVLELWLTDGTLRSFSVEEDLAAGILAFVQEAIEPYVTARMAGFDLAFGRDEQIEVNEARGVFHIIRQGGREITGEWPLDALERCEWTEHTDLSMLGSVVSGGIDLFQRAAKAAVSQSAAETEEKISSVDVVLTVRTDGDVQARSVCFGRSSVGMGRTDQKYVQCLEEWDGLSEYLKARCPACELAAPVLPEPEDSVPAPAPPQDGGEAVQEAPGADAAGGPEEPAGVPDAAPRRDDLGIARYIAGAARFIDSCATPMTIAFQGNRGSGKNNILRMLFEYMEGQYGGSLLWIPARDFPRDESGGALSVLSGKTLVESLNAGRSAEVVERLASVASGVIKVFADIVSPDSGAGHNLVDGLFNRKQAESISEMVKLFSSQVEARTRGENKKVVFFIDGLNQLDPPRAVELLEAMRDFFDCKGCVFIVAADAPGIFRGAQAHFDEARAGRFFDKVFKTSFQVPESSYNVQGYVEGKLADAGIQAGDQEELALYAALIQSSVGRDVEAIDRLFVSFQLLKDMTDGEVYKSRYKRLALFALLCMQTRFRAAYEYAMQRRERVTPALLEGLCGRSAAFLDADPADGDEQAAYQTFGGVFGQAVNLDGEAGLSEAECRAFAEVLELSGVTSRYGQRT